MKKLLFLVQILAVTACLFSCSKGKTQNENVKLNSDEIKMVNLMINLSGENPFSDWIIDYDVSKGVTFVTNAMYDKENPDSLKGINIVRRKYSDDGVITDIDCYNYFGGETIPLANYIHVSWTKSKLIVTNSLGKNVYKRMDDGFYCDKRDIYMLPDYIKKIDDNKFEVKEGFAERTKAGQSHVNTIETLKDEDDGTDLLYIKDDENFPYKIYRNGRFVIDLISESQCVFLDDEYKQGYFSYKDGKTGEKVKYPLTRFYDENGYVLSEKRIEKDNIVIRSVHNLLPDITYFDKNQTVPIKIK